MRNLTTGARAWLRLGLLTIALGCYVGLFMGALIDDAYITLQYARNLALHGMWGMLPDRMANTATSPLFVIVLAAFTVILRNSEIALHVTTTALLLLTWWGLRVLARELFASTRYAWIAFAGLIANPLLLSTFGLEPYLFIACFAWVLVFVVQGRVRPAGLMLGLLMLTRLEGVLVAPLIALVIRRPRQVAAVAGWSSLVLVPWLLFSWIVLGSFVPDTLIIKTNESHWGALRFYNGPLLYAQRYPWEFGLAMAWIAALPLLVRRWTAPQRRVLLMAGGFGVLHYAAYSWLNVPPYHWYYAPATMAGLLCASLGLTGWLERGGRRRAIAGGLGLIYLTLVLRVLIVSGPFKREALIHTNWAAADGYRRAADAIRMATPPDSTIVLYGEIGTLLYCSEREMRDMFTDRRFIREMVDAARAAAGLRGLLWRANFAWSRIDSRPIPEPDYRIYIEPDFAPPQAGAAPFPESIHGKWTSRCTYRIVAIPK